MFFLLFKAAQVVKKNAWDLRTDGIWKSTYAHAPQWVSRLTLALVAYTVFYFFFAHRYLNDGLTPDIVEGRFVMQYHGHIVRELSQADFGKHKASELRGKTTPHADADV